MRRMSRLIWLGSLLGLVALLAFSALAGATAAQSNGSAQIALIEEPDPLLVGDPFTLEVTVTHPEGTEAVFPPLVGEWGALEVRSVSEPTVARLDGGSQQTTRRIEAALFAPGLHETPPLEIALYAPDGSVSRVSAETSPITIDSALTEGDTALRDIKPQATRPFVPPWAWVLGAGVLLLGAVVTVVAWQRMRRTAPALPPYEEAIAALDAIAAQDLPGKGAHKAYVTLVTDVVRRYCDRRFDLHVMESTTDEVRHLLPSSAVPDNQQRVLLTVLEDGDLVKFADIALDAESAAHLMHSARSFVETTKPVADAKQAEPPSTPAPPQPAEVIA